MADMTIVDDAQVRKLASDMRLSAGLSMTAIVATTVKAVKNIEREARQSAPKGPHVRQYAAMITSETKSTPWSVQGEVGPLQAGQGALGEILEFGTGRNAPHPHLMPAGDAEIPVWEKYIAQALGLGI